MTYQVVLTPPAQNDFMESLKWYSEQQEHLEERFYAAVVETIGLIAENPRLFVERKKSVRVAVVQKFPFLIFYQEEVAKQRVVVLAILHQSRNPKIWMKR